MPTTSSVDIPVDVLRKIIRRLPEDQPVTDEFEFGAGTAWYRSQREHLDGWLSQYNGPGAYNRKKPSTSSRQFYNHFRCAAGLLWLAEALGEDPAVLRSAVKSVRAAGKNPSSQCAAFRRAVPWSRIVELVEAQPKSSRAGKPPTILLKMAARYRLG